MGKSSRRIVGLLISVVFIVSITASAFADNITFSCNLADSIERSSSEWMEDETSRALVTVLLVFELMTTEGFSIDGYHLGESMVAMTDNTITVAVAGDEKGLIIFYSPEYKHAQYTTISQNTFLELYLAIKTNDNVVIENDTEALTNVLDLLSNLQ